MPGLGTALSWMRSSVPSGGLPGHLWLTDQSGRPPWKAERRSILMSSFLALGPAGPEADWSSMGLGHLRAHTKTIKADTTLATKAYVCQCVQHKLRRKEGSRKRNTQNEPSLPPPPCMHVNPWSCGHTQNPGQKSGDPGGGGELQPTEKREAPGGWNVFAYFTRSLETMKVRGALGGQ